MKDTRTLLSKSEFINLWKWLWLEAEIDGECRKDCIRKLSVAGKAYCKLCNCEIEYDKQGKPVIIGHTKSCPPTPHHEKYFPLFSSSGTHTPANKVTVDTGFSAGIFRSPVFRGGGGRRLLQSCLVDVHILPISVGWVGWGSRKCFKFHILSGAF